MQPEYQGNDWAIYLSDCVEWLAAAPESSVDLSIFSPPFGDLFIYSDSERDMGNSSAAGEFDAHYRFFAEALLRVIKPGRLVAVHCSDLPSRKGRDGFIGLRDFSGDLIRAHDAAGFHYHGRVTVWKDPVVEMQRTKALGLLYKQLQKDSAMSRPGMPDYVMLFRKPGENAERVTHRPAEFPVERWQEWASPVWTDVQQSNVLNNRVPKGDKDEKHICPLQLDLIERLVVLYSNPADVILDPFNGIGSTGYVALKHGRKYVGCELKPEYAALAARFLAEAEGQADLFAGAA